MCDGLSIAFLFLIIFKKFKVKPKNLSHDLFSNLFGALAHVLHKKNLMAHHRTNKQTVYVLKYMYFLVYCV